MTIGETSVPPQTPGSMRAVRVDRALAATLLLILLLASIPLLSGGSFAMSRYIVALCYLIAAIGLNLAMGYAGEFAMGHPVIMAVGAYAAGILSARLGWPLLLTLPCGLIAGTLAGLLIMSPGLRVRGWYYSLLTMFAVLVLPKVVALAEPLTGGDDGLSGVMIPSVFGYEIPNWLLFEFALACLVLIWLLIENFMRSAWGYRLRALRDARQAAEAVGIDLGSTRLVVYLLSSAPAALAGIILAYAGRFVSADMFGVNLMLMFLAGIVLGGAGTRWGPFVGMVPLLFLSFWVGPFSQYNAVGLGVGMLISTLLFPNGIAPALAAAARRRRAGAAAPGEQAQEGVSDGPREKPVPTPAAIGREPILVAENIVKSFGGNMVLCGVSLTIRAGTLCGLVGPNGSGKSTFLNALSGFLRSDAGTVRIGGADVAGLPVHRVARGGIGRTFQVPQLIDEYTTLENIEVGLVAADNCSVLASMLQTANVRRAAAARRVRALEVFALLGLPPGARDLPAASLPLGLKRLVEVGRAIAAQPRLILLDEPAAGLSDQERHRLGELLVRLKSLGMTVLVVEHNVAFMLQFCDELVLLESGTVSCTANLAEPLPESLLAYLGHRPGDAARQGGG